MSERDAIVRYILSQKAEHTRTFEIARSNGDDNSMDRCAARARTCGRLAQAIEDGLHLDG